MTTALITSPAVETGTRFGGHEPPTIVEVIKVEAKRALWIYPICFAAGAIGYTILSLGHALG